MGWFLNCYSCLCVDSLGEVNRGVLFVGGGGGLTAVVDGSPEVLGPVICCCCVFVVEDILGDFGELSS